MTAPDWPSIVAAAVAVVSGIVAVVLWVPKQITASRHKAANDLQPKFESFDRDIEKHADRLTALESRVAALEAVRRGRGAD